MGGAWGRGKWPAGLYTASGRLCERHRVATRIWGGKRRAAELQATPAWADGQQIQNIYRVARSLELKTGTKQHVDHIIPLRGKTVCGLHVEANLQVLSAPENIRKGNRMP